MWQWIHKMGSPKRAYQLAAQLQPWFLCLTGICLIYGLIGGLMLAPPDYQQGDAFRIIYIHVPAAVCSLGVYVAMAVASLFFLVWKLKVADMFAKQAAVVGAVMTALALVTGAIWGKPTWGTYWIWDARLTSELILLFIYFGVIAIRDAMPEQALASKVTAIVTVIGLINIPIIHYSVDWWHTLHQGATILKFGKPSIAPAMLHPLLAMLGGFICFIAWLFCMRIRAELLIREAGANWIKDI